MTQIYIVTENNTWDSYNSITVFQNKELALKYAHDTYLNIKDDVETEDFNETGSYESGDDLSGSLITIKLTEKTLNFNNNILFKLTIDTN